MTLQTNLREELPLVAAELARYNIDIATLSETRLAEEGHLTEVGAGYTFFWTAKSTDEKREAGVGFAIKTKLVKATCWSTQRHKRLPYVCSPPLPKKRFATIISVYAPNMTNPENVTEKFMKTRIQPLMKPLQKQINSSSLGTSMQGLV